MHNRGSGIYRSVKEARRSVRAGYAVVLGVRSNKLQGLFEYLRPKGLRINCCREGNGEKVLIIWLKGWFCRAYNRRL